ncbi:MAG: hypothetical protein AAF085_08570 [Planctomycetota bacterium]
MKRKPATSKRNKKQAGYQVWHFALAVPAIAITLQLMLGSLTPLPKEHSPYPTRYAAAFSSDLREYREYPDPFYDERQDHNLPSLNILPLNLRGDMTGPLLTSVLQDYFPESTAQHASDFRDTLPPCDNPRMIVIMPKDEEPAADPGA